MPPLWQAGRAVKASFLFSPARGPERRSTRLLRLVELSAAPVSRCCLGESDRPPKQSAEPRQLKLESTRRAPWGCRATTAAAESTPGDRWACPEPAPRSGRWPSAQRAEEEEEAGKQRRSRLTASLPTPPAQRSALGLAGESATARYRCAPRLFRLQCPPRRRHWLPCASPPARHPSIGSATLAASRGTSSPAPRFLWAPECRAEPCASARGLHSCA